MKLEHKALKITGIAVFTAICLGIFVWLFTSAGGSLPGGEKKYEARALVPTAFQLVPNADVRRAGVKIGRVRSITSRGDTGVVAVQIDKDQGPIYRNATVAVRTKTLVGENYIELNPGSPRSGRLADDGVIPLAQAEDAVQLDQILSGLDAPTRRAVRKNLDALGPGLRGRGDALGRLWAAAEPTSESTAQLTKLLDRQRAQLARVIDDTGSVLAAFGDRTADVRLLATSARSTADAAASRDEQISAVLGELPSTLTRVRSTATHLGDVATRSTPVVNGLRVATQQLRPVTRRLESAAANGRRLFSILPSFSKAADPMLASLERFGGATTDTVPQVDAVLRQLNPALGYLAPRATEMSSALATMASAADTRDATGNLGRIHLVVDKDTVTGLPKSVYDTIDTLLSIGGLSAIQRTGANAYPDPGTRGNPEPASGAPPRLVADPSALDQKTAGR